MCKHTRITITVDIVLIELEVKYVIIGSQAHKVVYHMFNYFVTNHLGI